MADDNELLKGNTQTLALAVLKDGPRHGYAIAREIEHRSANALQFKEGTLYPTLHALERNGFIVGVWNQENGKHARKVYTITMDGLAEFNRRTQTWNAFARAVTSVILGTQQGDSDAATPTKPGFRLQPHPEISR